MSRSLNKVTLIGNLTRDPEMRYTPQGHAVTTFGVATNREWKVDGDTREDTEFHNVVAWNKLAELCSQLLKKGTKVYIEGRLQTRDWVDDKGQKHYKTEIVSEDMIVLGNRRDGGPDSFDSGDVASMDKSYSDKSADRKTDSGSSKDKKKKGKEEPSSESGSSVDEDIPLDEIPF